ncbi:hypothetical protein B0H13DRAFT_2309119 [Mycena leptocephala]|nr:hypothetical protein B0H13DRAFT_2309119 [Mycena leptocephala]
MTIEPRPRRRNNTHLQRTPSTPAAPPVPAWLGSGQLEAFVHGGPSRTRRGRGRGRPPPPLRPHTSSSCTPQDVLCPAQRTCEEDEDNRPRLRGSPAMRSARTLTDSSHKRDEHIKARQPPITLSSTGTACY